VKILFWSETFWPLIRGVRVFRGRLATTLAPRGRELTIVARRDDDSLPDNDRHGDIRVRPFPCLVALHSRDLSRVVEMRPALGDAYEELYRMSLARGPSAEVFTRFRSRAIERALGE
jgi:hypothetical protein